MTEMLSTRDELISQQLLTITEQQSQLIHTITNGSNNNNATDTSNPQTAICTGSLYYWTGIDDKMHTVPFNFKFPSYTCNTMWNLWFFGNLNENIVPYKSISPAHDLMKQQCKINYCRTKTIMECLVQLAIDGNIIEKQKDITLTNSSSVYDFAYPQLLLSLYGSAPKRPADININTLANRKYKNRTST